MQSRVKAVEQRINREIEEKEGLLQDIEKVDDLKLMPLTFHKERLIEARDLTLRYPDSEKPVFRDLRFELNRGERIFLRGSNGCGKSSLIRAIRSRAGMDSRDSAVSLAPEQKELSPLIEGTLYVPAGMTISYIDQDTSQLSGTLREYAEKHGLNYSLLLTLLRKLDLERQQFEKNMQEFSEGQKKKVLIAASLITPAHLYIWDEPLNYIDIFSRMQIEQLIESCRPTMLIVEHDVRFTEKLATRIIEM